MKEWDVFISHASEDKDAVATPLAEALGRAGLMVWLDKHELRIGDSLREKIDEGLAKSCFGAVVLSRSFLAKQWPTRELNGLMAREEAGHKVILPVWHQIDKLTLVEYSPILADRLAGNTADGIEAVARQIAAVVLDPSNKCPCVLAPTVKRRLINLLDRSPDPSEVRDFLSTHPEVVERPLGAHGENTRLEWSVRLGQFTADFCVGTYWATKGRWTWSIVTLATTSCPLFIESYKPVPSVVEAVSKFESLRNWVQTNLLSSREALPDLSPEFDGIVVAGRRARLTALESELLARYNDLLFGVRVRTYDFLIDAAS